MNINPINFETNSSYQEWQSRLPLAVVKSKLWSIPEYRLARYASTLGSADELVLSNDLRTKGFASQLISEVDKIADKIAVAHKYKNPEARLRSYREAIEAAKSSWRLYYTSMQVLGHDAIIERFYLFKQIRAMLIDVVQTDLMRLNLVSRISAPDVHQNAMQMYHGMQQAMA